MSHSIKLKNQGQSVNTKNRPLPSELELGEIALNTSTNQMFIKKTDDSVIDVGACEKHFTASGTLESGDRVIVNEDGTVSFAGKQTIKPEIYNNTQFYYKVGQSSSNGVTEDLVHYDKTKQKIIIFNKEYGTTNYLMTSVGTITGSNIVFNTPTPVPFSLNGAGSLKMAYDDATSKFIIVREQSTTSPYEKNCFVGTLVEGVVGDGSDDTIEFSSQLALPFVETGTFASGIIMGITFDSVNNKFLLTHISDDGQSIYANVLTIIPGITNADDTIEYSSTPVIWDNTTYIHYQNCSYDEGTGKIIGFYINNNNDEYSFRIINIITGATNADDTIEINSTVASFSLPGDHSISTISPGTIAHFDNTNNFAFACPSVSSSRHIKWRDDWFFGPGFACVGTITLGATTNDDVIEIGPASECSYQYVPLREHSLNFNTKTKEVILTTTEYYGYGRGFMFTGSIEFGSTPTEHKIIFRDPTYLDCQEIYCSVYDSFNDKLLSINTEHTSPYSNTFVQIVQPEELVVKPNFISTNTNFVNGNGDTATVHIPNTNKFLYIWSDSINSYALIGTINNNNITFGNQYTISGKTIDRRFCYYDENSERIIMFYYSLDFGYIAAHTFKLTGDTITADNFTELTIVLDVSTYNSFGFYPQEFIYDKNNNKYVFDFVGYNGTWDNFFVSITITPVINDEPTITAGTIYNAGTGGVHRFKGSYDENFGKIVKVGAQGSGYTNPLITKIITLNGDDSFTFGQTTIVSVTIGDGYGRNYIEYNPIVKKHVINYYNNSGTMTLLLCELVDDISPTNDYINTLQTKIIADGTFYGELIYNPSTKNIMCLYNDLNATYKNGLGTIDIIGDELFINIENENIINEETQGGIDIKYNSYSKSFTVSSEVFSGLNMIWILSPNTIVNNLTSENFIGVANNDCADGEKAIVRMCTSTVENQRNVLINYEKYYLRDDGVLTDVPTTPEIFVGTSLGSTTSGKIIIKG